MTTLILAKYNDNDELIITNHVSLGVSIAKLKQHGMKVSNCPIDNLRGYNDANPTRRLAEAEVFINGY